MLWESRLGWAVNSAVKCFHSWDPAVSMPVKHTLFYNNPHIGSLHRSRNPINPIKKLSFSLLGPNTLQEATQGVEKFILAHALRVHSPPLQGRQGSKNTLDRGGKE